MVWRVGDIVVEVMVIGVSERKLLINDDSKKVSVRATLPTMLPVS